MSNPITSLVTLRRLDLLRKGREVKRFHTVPIIRENTVGNHSYGVAVLCGILVGDVAPERLARLYTAALTHDLPEHLTGDLQAPFKRAEPSVKTAMDEYEERQLKWCEWSEQLDERDQRVLKMADCFDGAYYAISEIALGNRTMKIVYHRYTEYLRSLGVMGSDFYGEFKEPDVAREIHEETVWRDMRNCYEEAVNG